MKKPTHVFLLCDPDGPFLGIACRRDKRRKSGFRPFASRCIRPPTGPMAWMKAWPCECGCGEVSWDSEAEEAIAMWLEAEMVRCRGENG